jgi:hypothetical protein
MSTRSIRTLLAVAAAACVAACGRDDAATAPHARFVKSIDGFYGPESAKYDPDQDVWFVSNMLGYGSSKDGAGYIVKIPAATLGPSTIFATSGRKGVQLDAPKGMAIHGDTLWVADIDVLRGFDRHTGAPIASIDFAPQHAMLLNDVTVGHDGNLYVTDSGFLMTQMGVIYKGQDKIFQVGPNHAVSVIASGAALQRPNGIIADPKGPGLLVVSFDPFRSSAYTLKPGAKPDELTHVAGGKGKFDGVEPLRDGRILVACWNDSSIHILGNARDEKIIRGLSAPADIGVDTRRNRIAIPESSADRVDFFELPR